jgi:hypothetical protein
MTMHLSDEAREARLQDWLQSVERLVVQIEGWCDELQWSVRRRDKEVRERLLGSYTVPELAVRTPAGEVYVKPIALHVVGADGRVDLEAWPSLNRVKLLRAEGGWRVVTDSNVPLHRPWDRDTFAMLVRDLSAS